MRFSAVILAGGKSSRMGRDKALLEINGQTLLARQIALAREAGAGDVLISGRAGADYSAFGVRVLEDHFQNAGPLAGVESALREISTSLLLVLAVDLPEMSAIFLRQLFSFCHEDAGAVPQVAGRTEPLAAFYPRAARSVAETLLGEGKNSVAHFAEHCVRLKLAQFIETGAGEQKFFANWNFPADISIVQKHESTMRDHL